MESSLIPSLVWTVFVLAAATYAEDIAKDYGGWRPWSKTDDPALDDGICNIDRISVLDLTEEVFDREYRRKKPVLITFPHGASDWTDADLWTEASLRRDIGRARFANNKAELATIRKNGTRVLTCEEYLEEMRNLRGKYEHGLAEVGYYFEDVSHYEPIASQHNSLKLPEMLTSNTSLDNIPIFFGGARGGDKFHKHAESWNAVIYGRKRWFFYPGHQTPPGGRDPGYEPYHWYKKVYPHLQPSEKPIECVQEAGEILYMAESYYHCTMNLAETVNIGSFRKEPTSEAEQLFYAAELNDRELHGVNPLDRSDSNHTHVINTILAILDIWPDQLDVLLRLGQEYHEIGDFQKALEVLTLVMHKDPRTVIAFVSLSKVYSSLNQYCTAEALLRHALRLNPSQFWAYDTYMKLLVHQKRHIDVLLLALKGYPLLWMDAKFWIMWAHTLQGLNLIEGAELVGRKLQQQDLDTVIVRS